MAIAKKVLEELGLSDKEAKVYLSLLELGASPVQKIGSKAGVNRATTYVCLEALLKIGLVSTVQKGVKTYFAPEHPEQLMSLVTKQEKEIERKKEELEGVINELKSTFETAGERPIVRFYESQEGIMSVTSETYRILKSKDKEGYGFIPLDNYLKTPAKYQSNSVNKRVDKSIKINSIYNFSGGPREDARSNKEKREAYWVPQEKFPFYCDINILGERVTIFIYSDKNPLAVVIEKKEIAETLKSIFKLARESALQYDKKGSEKK